MKKLLVGLSLTVAMVANATVDFPIDYSCNFSSPGELDAWTVNARTGEADGNFANLFEQSATPVYSANSIEYVLTNNTFADGSSSDAWLISPEFEVTSDNMMLSYFLVNSGDRSVATGNQYKVCYSSDGLDKTNFEENVLVSASINNISDERLSYSSNRVVISGLKGKKIRLAFVNEGNTTGLMGFGSIMVSPWYAKLDFQDSYNSLLVDLANPQITVSMTISTPVTARGYKAVLKTKSGQELIFEDNLKNFNIRNASTISFTFDQKLDIKDEAEPYTLTITPNFEGVVPFVVTGELIFAKRTYPMVAVAEELTGTWCGYCPGGIATLEYWNTIYSGTHARDKMVTIAIHNEDPMTPSDNSYYLSYVSQAKGVGITTVDPPMVVINRSIGGAPLQYAPKISAPEEGQPSSKDIEDIFAAKSMAQVKITSVEFDGQAGGTVKANYDYTTSYSAVSPGLSLAAIVLENDVVCPDPNNEGEWAQNNYFHSYTLDQIKAQYDEDFVRFMQPFVNPAPSYIPASEMKYQDVFRAAYPSYSGAALTDNVTADVATSGSVTFNMPENVLNLENAAVALILMKQGSNEVLGADVMKASDFVSSSVTAVTGDDFKVTAEEGIITISGTPGAPVSIFSIDGKMLHQSTLGNCQLNVATEASGLVIVKVGDRSTKVML